MVSLFDIQDAIVTALKQADFGAGGVTVEARTEGVLDIPPPAIAVYTIPAEGRITRADGGRYPMCLIGIVATASPAANLLEAQRASHRLCARAAAVVAQMDIAQQISEVAYMGRENAEKPRSDFFASAVTFIAPYQEEA